METFKDDDDDDNDNNNNNNDNDDYNDDNNNNNNNKSTYICDRQATKEHPCSSPRILAVHRSDASISLYVQRHADRTVVAQSNLIAHFIAINFQFPIVKRVDEYPISERWWSQLLDFLSFCENDPLDTRWEYVGAVKGGGVVFC